MRPPHSPQRPPSLLEIKELLMSGSEPEHAKARGAGPASASAAPSPSQHAATQPPAAAGDLQSQTKSPAPRIVRRASLRLSSMKSLSGGSRASDGASGASDAGLSSARVHQPLAETASPEQRRLEKRCAKAVHLLEQLQQQAMGVRPGAAGAEPLPPAALACCKVGTAQVSPAAAPAAPAMCTATRQRLPCRPPRLSCRAWCLLGSARQAYWAALSGATASSCGAVPLPLSPAAPIGGWW